MRVIHVYGIPHDAVEVSALKTELRKAVALELMIKPEQIAVFFPYDLLPKEQGREIIAFVSGLTVDPNRAREVRTKIAVKIKDILERCAKDQLFPEYKFVKVQVLPYNAERDAVYASSTISERPPGQYMTRGE
jgi:hypothetical protein